MMTADTITSSTMINALLLARFLDDELAQQSFLLVLGERA